MQIKEKDSVVALIITYNPDMDILYKNIEAVSCQLNHIIVFDNASKNANEICNLLTAKSNILLIQNDKNIGIAAALNRGFYRAKELGFEWILTLDQDSIIRNGLLEKCIEAVKDDKIAIVAAKSVDRNIQNLCKKDISDKIINVTKAITSGTLNSIKIWERMGGFDEFLFIDCVDDDYCNRLLESGYQILQVQDALFSHSIGETKQIILFGKPIYIFNHSADRKYYQVRNWIYLDYKYKGRITSKSVKHTLVVFLKVICAEKNKIKKIMSIWRGLWDGIKSKSYC